MHNGKVDITLDLNKAESQMRKKANSMKKEHDFSRGKRGAAVSQKGKTRITIFLDNEVIEEFRKRADSVCCGYQTMINEALRQYLDKNEKPVTEAALRQVIREEIRRAAHN